MPEAFNEFQTLYNILPDPIDRDNPNLRYLCALTAELAYHHVDQWEIDQQKRVKIFSPSQAYITFLKTRTTSNAIEIIGPGEGEENFVISEPTGVVVGHKVNDTLFIGFRGTKFHLDWRINFRAEQIPFGPLHWLQFPYVCLHGKAHRGFTDEATRISTKIIEKIENSNNNELNRIFLCGHSLGGAVAAISQNILNILNVEITTTVFGAPRYCNSEFLLPSLKNLPTQFRNYGDIVPFTPPRKMGYVDHPREYDTNGYLFQPVINQGAIGAVKGAWDGMKRGGSFFLNKCEPHNMENYRKNLGSLSDANDWEAPLTTLYAELQGHNF